MRYYLDTAPIIYWVERTEGWFEMVQTVLNRSECSWVSSDLARMECLVKPLRLGIAGLANDYHQFFNESIEEVVTLSTEVMTAAAMVRARHGCATPDAIHLAAALASRCDVFLTNDDRLRQIEGISVEVLKRIAP